MKTHSFYPLLLIWPVVLLLAVALLAGCASNDPMPVNVKITADTYCDTAEKITWSTADTAATIRQVRRENAKLDKCQKSAPTS
jgi:type IV pilus biogenesis protein CpaD/CtpE